jgi:hypothetical protein
MAEEFLVAQGRALDLIGEGVWLKLSETTRERILAEELRALNAERVKVPSTANGDMLTG